MAVRAALPRAVSIGVALTPEIIGAVDGGPTAAYYAEYQRVNAVLGKPPGSWRRYSGRTAPSTDRSGRRSATSRPST